MNVAFIGLGRMGRLMAANLERAGHALRTYDLNGSGNCASPEEAAAGAEVLIAMVPDGKAVRDAVLAALPGLAPGSIVIDMSSSDPRGHRAPSRCRCPHSLSAQHAQDLARRRAPAAAGRRPHRTL